MRSAPDDQHACRFEDVTAQDITDMEQRVAAKEPRPRLV